jgi:poly(A) polymerase
MRDVHVLEEVIPGDIDLEPLARLCELDARNGLAPDAILRLCGLMRGGAAVNELASRWRLSNDDRARLSLFFKVGVLLDFPLDDAALAPALYRHGAAAIGGLLKLDWARSGDPLDDPRRLKTLRFVETWRRPVLPVDGGDVLRAGIPEGPLVGGVLGTLEDWWIQAGFPVDADIVRRRLHEIVAGTKAF